MPARGPVTDVEAGKSRESPSPPSVEVALPEPGRTVPGRWEGVVALNHIQHLPPTPNTQNDTIGIEQGIHKKHWPGAFPGRLVISASFPGILRSRWSDSNRRPAVYETAALPLSYTGFWSPRRDSNPGPQSYQDCALPPELRGPTANALSSILDGAGSCNAPSPCSPPARARPVVPLPNAPS